jgi:hypothetical protein
MRRIPISLIYLLLFALLSCQGDPSGQSNSAAFKKLDSGRTGITFNNTLTETAELNVLNYEYFYNGGGVAVGDFNNDGLPDLYFTGNMVPNHLYLNQGELQFTNATEAAGLSGKTTGWNTGVSLVDINSDGQLDIYLCYSGNGSDLSRKNELYLNEGLQNGVPRFREAAAEYGLDLPTHTTQALFFDFDRDSDLDVYLLNHSIEDFQNFDATFVKNQRDPLAGDRLLRNDDGKFTDISEAAGIKGTPLGFGLGVAATDVNNDGWLDLYISNDYIEEDYLYINQQDGTFRDELKTQMGHTSHFSMGSNVADINNDGWMDILSLDMLPEDNRRQKLLYGPDTYEKYQYMLRNGFYHQIMRNMLQLNNGDGTFSEIGQLAGISNTDWSWSPLFGDFDNDGWQDLFVTNGYLRDYTNRDFVSYYADQRIKESRGEQSEALLDIIARMPSTPTPNYIFRNQGDLTFENKNTHWGFSEEILSNGAVAADLDLDGDLDLVVNHLNQPSNIYENRVASGNYLKVKLEGPSGNRQAIGAKVQIKTNQEWQSQEFVPTRGFQSAMSVPLHFGLGDNSLVDSLIVHWPDGSSKTFTSIAANQIFGVSPQDGSRAKAVNNANTRLFQATAPPIPYQHQENPEVDFKNQSLLTYALSYQGPSAISADFTGDGLQDLFLGGAKMQAATLWVQTSSGTWEERQQNSFRQDLITEDVVAVSFDADGDGDLDIYAGSGGYHYLPEDLALQDRLYLNDGQGNFAKASKALPMMRTSTGAIAQGDFDLDGDIDLFVGGRLIPGQYPKKANSYLLENQGDGTFQLADKTLNKELSGFGLVTAAEPLDLNADGRLDILIAGEWMPITALLNLPGGWELQTDFLGSATNGWWQSLHAADLDGDGDQDLIAGNLGTNTNLKVSIQEPARMYVGDFDNNGTIDPLLTHFIQGKAHPFYSRDNLFGQLTALRKKFTTYESYADATIEDILSPQQIQEAEILEVTEGASIWIENLGAGKWQVNALPNAAQMAPVFAIQTADFNGDGRLDLLLAGNLADTRPTMGPWDANYGQVFINTERGFEYYPPFKSGLQVIGDVRNIICPGPGQYWFIRNNQTPLFYRLSERLSL